MPTTFNVSYLFYFRDKKVSSRGLFINHVIGLIDVWVKENIMKHHVDGVWGVLISIFM